MTDAPRPGSARRIWAAVPFRGPVGSKRRLAGLLDAAERERLSVAMLLDVLEVLLEHEWIERVLLLRLSSDGVEVPQHQRLIVVEEPRDPDGSVVDGGLNGALRHAQQVAEAGGAESLLIVPADVPLIDRPALEAIRATGSLASVVIVPDRAEEGTNALMLTPPAVLAPSFGEGSYTRHVRQANEAGLYTIVVEQSGLELDLDTPADIAELLTRDHAGRAATLLRELGVDHRLEQLAATQARSTTI
jgi:2-phospho-L-lactate/phosphoenolpyruvate guanylyltransferase